LLRAIDVVGKVRAPALVGKSAISGARGRLARAGLWISTHPSRICSHLRVRGRQGVKSPC